MKTLANEPTFRPYIYPRLLRANPVDMGRISGNFDKFGLILSVGFKKKKRLEARGR